MSNIAIQDLTIPSLGNTYTFTQVDNTLTQSGKAADAKKTGDEISSVKQDLTNIGLSVVDGKLSITYEEVTE